MLVLLTSNGYFSLYNIKEIGFFRNDLFIFFYYCHIIIIFGEVLRIISPSKICHRVSRLEAPELVAAIIMIIRNFLY